MKYRSPRNLGLAAFLTFLTATAVNAACYTKSGVTISFYGYSNNDPTGAGTAYSCAGRNNVAGGKRTTPFCNIFDEPENNILGIGTYSNPLTFASAPGEFSDCEIIYLPYLKKYLRFEDSCAQCSKPNRSPHFWSIS